MDTLLLCCLTITAVFVLGFCLGYQHRKRQAFFGGYRAMGFTEDEIQKAWHSKDKEREGRK